MSIVSTAEILSDASYSFGSKTITIKARAGVVGGGNYYVDLAVPHLHPIASNKEYTEFFEPGVGRGFYFTGLLSLPNMTYGRGVDVNPRAIELAKANLKTNGIDKSFELTVMNVHDYLKKDFQVDLFACDISHIPTPENPSDYALELPPLVMEICNGGPNGRKYIDLMITKSPEHLRQRGSIFLAPPEFVCEGLQDLMRENGFEPIVLAQHKKLIDETYTTKTLRPYIEAKLGYQFRKSTDGDYFFINVIHGVFRG